MNSVITKFQLAQGFVITLILGAFIFVILSIMESLMTSSAKNDFQEKVKDIKTTFEVLDSSIIQSAKSASNVFSSIVKNIDIDENNKVLISGVETSLLTSNGNIINNNNAFIDEFTKLTGAVATVFVKQGDDFFRIATSLQKDDGSRALGTFLTEKSPAFPTIIKKEKYIGSAKLFGKNYMTIYEPIIKDGEVIAILFIGYNFDNLYNILEQNLSKIQLGETGYIFTINNKDSEIIMHPKLKGKNINELDENNKELLNKIIKEKEGVFIYNQILENNKSTELVTAFTTFPNWNTVIATSVNIDELLSLNAILKNYLFIGSLILFLTLLGLNYFVIQKIVNKPLISINSGLNKFFAFLNRDTSETELIKYNSDDEFGQMAKVINQNILKIKDSIEEDNKLISEAIESLGEVQKGDFSQRLKSIISNPSLHKLKIVINNMTENLEKNVNNVLHTLDEYSQNKYINKINSNELKGHLLNLSKNVNSLRDTITSILVENKSNGLTLQHSSKSLLENVDNLNRSSNQAATSLEETAAALEEITSNLRSNNENISMMSKYSNDIIVATHKGEQLANETTVSMEEINNQVNQINDAITVIDQIAFQTNILSLNAAVEAATAGEAGKGFAVVAGEVRNLANRSAEAAKDIKKIVELATIKANEGKDIANSMIMGYGELNKNIENTISLIKNVEMASKEQLLGIEQINDAVNSLDKQTQQNANVANFSHNIATETDFISNLIVKNANDKEFIGKDSVEMKNMQKILNNELI